MQNGQIFGSVGGMIKSIQRGTITLNNVLTNTATITAVVTANCELRLLGWGVTGVDVSPNKWMPRITLTDATTITATVNTAFAANNVISFEVIEYIAGVVKTINRGSKDTSTGTTVTIAAVDMTKTHINHLGATTADTNAYSSNANMPSLTLTNGTTVTFGVLSGIDHIVSYEVVEFV